MFKLFLKNNTNYTLRLTSVQGESDHFGCPGRPAISAEAERGNEVEITEARFLAVAGDVWRFVQARYLEIIVRDGRKESTATFDQVWAAISNGRAHPKEYRAARRRQVAGEKFPAPLPVPPPAREAAPPAYEQSTPAGVMGEREKALTPAPDAGGGIPNAPPSVDPGAQGG